VGGAILKLVRKLALSGRFCLAAACLIFSAPAAAQDIVAPKITAIRAQLYYEETASFSENVVAPSRLALWNVIIGGGDVEHPSNSTLVTVEVRGRHVAVTTVTIEVTATNDDSTVLAHRSMIVDLYGNHTEFYAPLFLYDTGCQEITISARLVGAGADPTVSTATIPFQCGE